MSGCSPCDTDGRRAPKSEPTDPFQHFPKQTTLGTDCRAHLHGLLDTYFLLNAHYFPESGETATLFIMGATPSVQRDAKSPEDAPEDISAELSDAQNGETLDGKVTLRLKRNIIVMR